MLDRRVMLQFLAAGAGAAALAGGAAEAASDDLYVIAEIVAKPDHADAFRPMLQDFIASARKEPGCKHYALLEDAAKPGRFLTFETWSDMAALQTHLNTPAIKALGPMLKEILEKDPVITPLKMLSDA